MKILLAALLLFCFFPASRAQIVISAVSVKGSVVDSLTGKPLVYVTVALQDVKTGLATKSALSKEDGSFEVAAPGNKVYQLALTFSGYDLKILTNINSTSINVGKITLSPSGTRLKEVTIAGVRPVIKREIDGISYDVSADPESVALTALDMMRKIPLLTVDASDNIKLKGSGNYKILINGKESALFAKNPSDILRAMPATNIEKIEVITTPPAKYDAEGLAGIINIITKKNIGQGYNIGVNGRYNTVWGPGLNVNGTLKQGKFGLSAFAGYNVHDKQTTGFGNAQTFFADNSSLSQSGTKAFKGRHDYTNLDLSYEIDSLNLLTGSFEMDYGTNIQTSEQFSNTHDTDFAVIQKYHLQNNGNSNFGGLDAGINYQLGFKEDKNRLLTFSYKYNYSPSKQFNDNSFLRL